MNHQLAGILMSPILLKQGKQVRQHITLLPEPPGDRQGVTGTGPVVKLLIIGDSAGAGVGAAHQSEALSGRIVESLAPDFTVHWRLAARSGATVPATLRHLKRLEADAWDWVVISLGANDVVTRDSREHWRENLNTLRDLIQTRFGRPRILFSGLPPMHLFPALPQPLRWYLGARAKDFDRTMAQWASGQDRCERLPTDFPRDAALMASDGFHPGPGLYTLWGRAVADHIRSAGET